MRRLGRRAVVALTSSGLALSAATGAYAYWRTTGSGSGTATAANPAAIRIDPGLWGPHLYPGATVDVDVTMSNPNGFTVKLNNVVLDTSQGTGGFESSSPSTCPGSVLTFNSQSNGGSGWTLPAKTDGLDGSLYTTLNGAVTMATSAPNGCQNVNFTIYLKAA